MFNLLCNASAFWGKAIPLFVLIVLIVLIIYNSFYTFTFKKLAFLISRKQYELAFQYENFLIKAPCLRPFIRQCVFLNLALAYFITKNDEKFLHYASKLKTTKLQESKFFLLTMHELIKNNLQLAMGHYKSFLASAGGEHNTLYKTILCGAFNFHSGEFEQAKAFISKALPDATNPVVIEYLQELLNVMSPIV